MLVSDWSYSRMPTIVDLRTAADPRDVVHKAVQALAEGGLVGLPTETGYVAAALPLHALSVEFLDDLARRIDRPGLCLALKSPLEALDYLPKMGPLARKLIRRFWPGPVTIQFEATPTTGLLDAFPRAVGQALCPQGSLAIRIPAHEFFWNVLRLLPAPLAVTPEATADGKIIRSAAEFGAAVNNEIAFVVDAGEPRHDLPTSNIRIQGESWEMLREGAATRRTLNRLAGNMVLFVCTGNTCRSPMAEGLYRKLLAERLKCSEDDLVDQGFMVVSAGVAAGPGSPSSPEAVEVLSERGVDISGHESQQVTPQLLAQADQIFTMTRGHRELLVREFPDISPRVRLVSRTGTDVIDPIGAGMDEYRRCADQIEKHIQDILAESPATGS